MADETQSARPSPEMGRQPKAAGTTSQTSAWPVDAAEPSADSLQRAVARPAAANEEKSIALTAKTAYCEGLGGVPNYREGKLYAATPERTLSADRPPAAPAASRPAARA